MRTLKKLTERKSLVLLILSLSLVFALLNCKSIYHVDDPDPVTDTLYLSLDTIYVTDTLRVDTLWITDTLHVNRDWLREWATCIIYHQFRNDVYDTTRTIVKWMADTDSLKGIRLLREDGNIDPWISLYLSFPLEDTCQ